MRPIDIVVPVYRGERETRACLDSVLAARGPAPAHVLVVDDASPEPSLSAWLRELARAGAIELLVHAQNRGFVASCNEAMARHPDRDVLLLNSDTEVAPGWLERLAACAGREASAGTVTPFSNNATILSYPRTLVANPMPEGETTASLDAAFARANAGASAEVPTAVGFCMYIARRCLEAIGGFDEARYGAGYGEEVDFCMRAARAGFRNLAAADVFVAHVGEVSFGGTGMERRARAQATVDALYPEFQQRLRAFIPADPLATLRRRADLVRLRRRGPDALALEPAAQGHLRLHWEAPGEEFSLWLPGTDGEALLRLVAYVAGVGAEEPPAIEASWTRAPQAPAQPPARDEPAATTASTAQAELALARARLAELEARLAVLEGSRSWRLTEPLRRVARRLRGQA